MHGEAKKIQISTHAESPVRVLGGGTWIHCSIGGASAVRLTSVFDTLHHFLFVRSTCFLAVIHSPLTSTEVNKQKGSNFLLRRWSNCMSRIRQRLSVVVWNANSSSSGTFNPPCPCPLPVCEAVRGSHDGKVAVIFGTDPVQPFTFYKQTDDYMDV